MDYLIYFFIFFFILILIIFGLPFRTYSFNNQISRIQSTPIRENFKTSSNQSIKQGASTFYDWGVYATKHEPTEECDPEPHPQPKPPCPNGKCLDGDTTYIENDYYIYPERKERIIHEKADCSKCDAFRCKDINKYVLKSSVPPCPDMSKYALKSMVKTCPDMSKYIKKSEIPPCPECPDMRNYVRKSEIPVCPPPVTCPTCPVCPPAYEHIQDDPRFKNWLLKYEHEIEKKINKLYIRKSQCIKDANKAYRNGMEKGKYDAYRNIANKCKTPQHHPKKPKQEEQIQPSPQEELIPSSPQEELIPSFPQEELTPSQPQRQESNNGSTNQWNGKTTGECDNREFVPGWSPSEIGYSPFRGGCKPKGKFNMGSGVYVTNKISPKNS